MSHAPPLERDPPAASRRTWLARCGASALWFGALAGGNLARAAAASELEFGADFDPVSAVWLGFAPGHDEITAGLAAALRPHVGLKYLLRDEDDEQRLKALLAERAVPIADAEFFSDAAAGYFLRDLVVFAHGAEGELAIVDFRATFYGTAAWCRNRFVQARAAALACVTRGDEIAEGRDRVDRAIARRIGADVIDTSLAAEGGGIEVNGRGLMIANETLWHSRNPGLTRDQLERAMLRLPGIRKVIWLPAGLAEDVHLRGTIVGDHVGWGTGGHTDEFVRFVDERTVLLAWPDDGEAASHPVSRLTRQRMQRNLQILEAASDVRGRRLQVIKVPMPRLIEREVTLSQDADAASSDQWSAAMFPVRERRRNGQTLTQVATATYLNFVLANEALVVPDYLPHGTTPQRQEQVRRLLLSVLPGRSLSFVDPITANWVGGGLHCATACEPAPPA